MTTAAPILSGPASAPAAASPASHAGKGGGTGWLVLTGLALQAQESWAALPVKQRLAILRKFRHRLALQPDLFTAALDHLPRTPAQSVVAELLPLADACRFLERQAARILKPVKLGRDPFWLGNISARIEPAPLGLVLILAPSNYPLFLPGVQLLQALAAGNAVLFKPGLQGTRAAQALAEALHDAGLPPHLLTVLPEDTATAAALLDFAPLAKVFLTGSFATGQKVLAALARRAIPAVAELSGCDAAVLCPSAAPDRFLAALRFGLLLNQGQTCIAPRRAFIPQAVISRIEGPLARSLGEAPAHPIPAALFARIRTLVDEATHAGARLLTPFPASADAFTPLLLTQVSPTARIASEDLFAPILSLIPYAAEEDLAAMIHRCPYALGLSVFGPEPLARGFARQLRAGTVTINDLIAPTADPRVPFAPGPNSRSGFGASRGPQGLLEMTTTRTTLVRRGHFLPHLQPPTPRDHALFTHLLRATHAPAFHTRLAHLCRFFQAALRSRTP